jgi:hypothetical protein
MHQTSPEPALATAIRFGSDREHLFVRIDTARSAVDLLAEGYECSLKFLRPARVRFSVRQEVGRLTGAFWDRTGGEGQADGWIRRGTGTATVAAGDILELAIPYADLHLTPGETTAFFVAFYDMASAERERHPKNRPIEVTVPDARYVAGLWSV